MSTPVEYTPEKLAAMLRRKPMTAKQIATALDCSKFAAYERVRSLKKHGFVVMTEPAPLVSGVTGPRAVAYFCL